MQARVRLHVAPFRTYSSTLATNRRSLWTAESATALQHNGPMDMKASYGAVMSVCGVGEVIARPEATCTCVWFGTWQVKKYPKIQKTCQRT